MALTLCGLFGGSAQAQTSGMTIESSSTMTVIANLLIATGRFEEALQMSREAQRILAINLPEDHWRVAAASIYEGRALAGIGRFDEAEPILLGSLDSLAQAPIPDLEENSRRAVAQFYIAWGRPEQAENFTVKE